MSVSNLSSGKRFKKFCLIMVSLLVLLAVRLAWVQLVDGRLWSERAREQLQESRSLQTARGAIYDRGGKELAISHMAKSLYANPREVKDPDVLAKKLAPLLQMDESVLRERLKVKGAFIWLKRTLEPAEYQRVADVITKEKIRGLDFQEESRRVYPNDMLAAHILGFVGTDDKGLTGIEMAMDSTIRGQTHKQILDTDSKGIPIFKSIFAFQKPKSGHSIYLTIDSAIQFAVEQVLDNAIVRTKAQAATMIVMNPKTGEILAMASRPAFNPNSFFRFKEQDWRNRAIATIYEPGSTFKAIVAASAFQEKVVTAQEIFNDTGAIDVGGRVIQNWDGGSYGRLPFSDFVKYSINTGFAEVAKRMGGTRMLKYSEAFGFGKATGIELPGEEEGMLLSLKAMQPSDVATMGIGQAIAVTPIQLLTAISSLANDGKLLKPHIIKEIRDSDGLLVSYSTPQVVRQTVSPEVAHETLGLMEKVVTEGGGKRGKVEGYRFAGKTGTAERLRDNGAGYDPGRYIASFVGVGPVEDAQLAGLVVLDSPKGLYYGGEVAAPVFAEAMTQIVRILGVRPSQVLPAFQPPKPGTPPPAAPPKAPAQMPPAIMPPGKFAAPDVRGRTIREAAMLLQKNGLSLIPEGSGVAVRQSVAPNAPVAKGTEITVYFEPR
ncbi:MAG TPA: penicillin-binding transpeptidase domain-containing protein [Negativicutes bacterium]|nr:penicillin-binding transpeptidase domain-containing protein [Negativicutes bacterium]